MKTLKKILYWFFVLLFVITFFLSIYFRTKFKFVTTEQMIYSFLYAKGTSLDSMKDGFMFVTVRTILFITIIYLIRLYIIKTNSKYYIKIKINNKLKTIDLLRITKLKKVSFLICIMIISLYSMVKALKIDKYIVTQKTSSNIFEKNYVNPEEVKIQFPEEKQNLIYIFVESLEMTNISKTNGGLLDESYIPNLEKIALNNDNFSNSDLLGGAKPINGTGWTAASLIAQTSGVPLKLQIDGSGYKGYKESLPGAYTIGEVLENNGYKNYFMLGSDGNYGRRSDYFKSHGNYEILDYYYAKDHNWIPEDYHVWWGYEDKKLYEFAKKELINIANNNEPFNFTMLTADTHFENGYSDISCPINYENPYANSIYCTDMMLNDFIEWVKTQDFYYNTTIIITGDHLTMQSGFYDELMYDDYDRTIYNVIINSKTEITNNKNRNFTLFDMYPTTLASLGAKIEGNKLGLGTNLYSKKQTITEKYGYEYVNNELEKKSLFYDNYLSQQ